MKKYAYENAETDDLWEVLTQQGHTDKTLDSSLTLKSIMTSWTLQKGYPLLEIKRNKSKLIITQKWFLVNPLNKAQNNKTEYDSYKWLELFLIKQNYQ